MSGFWQLSLHLDSYSACGIVTPKRVIASKRVLPGLANATAHFQSTVEPLFASLRDKMKARIDAFNLHAATEENLLSYLETFFAICARRNLFLSASKCVIFAKSIKWCGCIVSADGYHMDPSRLEDLRDMDMPRTAVELSEFIYCCRWMSVAIPDFASRCAPLTKLLEAAYTKTGKRNKRSIRNVALSSLPWGPTEEQCFYQLQDTLRNAVKLSYPLPDKEVCMYTDASDRYWSAVVTQVDKRHLSLPLADQRHDPLAFLGGAFKGAGLDWSTFEKEGFAIFQTFQKLDYLFLRERPPHVFTDHPNLLFVFAPLALEPALGRHVVSEVQRWALFLSRFDYFIEHISGTANVFADILTRWVGRYRRETSMRSVCSLF